MFSFSNSPETASCQNGVFRLFSQATLLLQGGNRIGQPGSTYQVPDAARYIGVAGVIYEGVRPSSHQFLLMLAIFTLLAIDPLRLLLARELTC